MGAWGVGLYSNDLAMDAKDDCRDVFSVRSAQEGVEILKNEYLKEIDEYDFDELADFWYALGDTMWNNGILTKEVKNKCLDLLGKKAGLALWIEAGNKSDIKKREKVLDNLKIKLTSLMPPKKKIKSSCIHSKWRVGDIIAFKPSDDWIYTDSIRWNWDLLTEVEILNFEKDGYKKESYFLKKDFLLWKKEGFLKKNAIAFRFKRSSRFEFC